MNTFGYLILLDSTWFNGSTNVLLTTVEVNVNQTGILKLCVCALIFVCDFLLLNSYFYRIEFQIYKLYTKFLVFQSILQSLF